MINFANTTFVKSAPCVEEKPQGKLPEVLVVGKSNVGKSSLINALCRKKQLAFTSSKPGHTRLLNYYLVDSKFYLVDAPGYGFAKGGIDLDQLFANMMNDYFSKNPELRLVLILIDSRRGVMENDAEILSYVQEEGIPYYLVATKVDKLNQSEKAAFLKGLAAYHIKEDNIYMTSSLIPRSLNKLETGIVKSL